MKLIPKGILISLLSAVAPLSVNAATILVDYSPDTTGVSVLVPNYANGFDYLPGPEAAATQVLGDQFTLTSASIITGGSIFSGLLDSENNVAGAVGDSVRFVVLPASGPGVTPTFDVSTTLDAVDSTFTTTQPLLRRKHATIDPQLLDAGTYWFYITGSGKGGNISQGTGDYSDGTVWVGQDLNPDLESSFSSGDTFFQIEGVAQVPLPAAAWLFGSALFGLVGLAAGRKKA